MDESFRHKIAKDPEVIEKLGFHPCFNGWVFQTETQMHADDNAIIRGFHPCFNGWVFQTVLTANYKKTL